MIEVKRIPPEELNAMLRNAELRNELEPYYDESISQVELSQLSLTQENEYLASMLAWETAPSLPIFQWFSPPLMPASLRGMTAAKLREELWGLIAHLYAKQIVLDFTDHLSDEELYLLICHEILPCREKMIEVRNGYLHWDCAGINENQDTWLTYYATEEEREAWEDINETAAPPQCQPPYPRNLPGEPG